MLSLKRPKQNVFFYYFFDRRIQHELTIDEIYNAILWLFFFHGFIHHINFTKSTFFKVSYQFSFTVNIMCQSVTNNYSKSLIYPTKNYTRIFFFLGHFLGQVIQEVQESTSSRRS